jgi:uncharacterized protein DUF6345
MQNRSKRQILCAGIGAGLVAVTTQASAARFGTYCQANYENNWAAYLDQVWTTCAWFNDELNDTDWHVFYYDLNGKKFFLESQGDHQPNNDSADDVDLLFMYTHGGADPGLAKYAMYNWWTAAVTTSMRLGDSAWWGGGLAILATYSCHTLQIDNDIVNRWLPVVSGGLKIVLGSHDIVNNSVTTNEVGEDFADYLQHGWRITDSWFLGLNDWYTDQDVAVMVTGTDGNNCWNRYNMNWQTYGNHPFLRDGQIGFMCLNWADDT